MRGTKITHNTEVQDAIALLRELKKSASPEQLIALQNELFLSSHRVVFKPLETSSPDPKSPLPLRSDLLIRRRSFLTPGVATREEGNNLQNESSSPKVTSAQIQAWSPEMFGQSPLSKLAGWESKNDGLSERAATPDIDHSYLGAHAIGSLRITNGSPAPSLASKIAHKSSGHFNDQNNDYSLAREGLEGRDLTKDGSNQAVKSARSLVGHETLGPIAMDVPTSRLPLEEDTLNATSNATMQDNYEKPSTIRAPMPEDLAKENNYPPLLSCIPRSASVLKPYQREANSNPFHEISNEEEHISVLEDDPQNTYHKSAISYQTEANSNPFRPLEGNLNRDNDFVGPSGFGSICDLPSSAATGSFVVSQSSSLDVNVLADRKYQSPTQDLGNVSTLDEVDYYSKSFPLSATSSIYTAGSKKENSCQMNYIQYDSGYGSQTSSQTSKDTLLIDDRFYEERFHRSTNNVPPSQPLYKVKTSSGANDSSKALNPSMGLNTGKPLPIDPPHAVAGPYMSKERPLSTSILQTETGSITESPAKSPKSKLGPNKLQKKRPHYKRTSSEPPIVPTQAQSNPKLDGLPQIPSEIATRHSQRMSQYPNMEHLERTYKSTSHEGWRDSFESAEPFNVQIRFPSPNRSPIFGSSREHPQAMRRSSFGAEHIQSFFRRSSGRSKPKNNASQQEHIPQGIADFGTVADSLGSSPYDFATTYEKSKNRGRPLGPRRATSPYQMGTSHQRPKSAIGMTDEVASRVALQRSKDRHELSTGKSVLQADSNARLESRPQPHPQLYRADLYANFSERPRPTIQGDRKAPRPRSQEVLSTNASGATKVCGHREWESERNGRRTAKTTTNQSPSPSCTPGRVHADHGNNNPVDWSDSAKAWRMRRKSIGENLRNNALQQMDQGISKDGGYHLIERSGVLQAKSNLPTINNSPTTTGDNVLVARNVEENRCTSKSKPNPRDLIAQKNVGVHDLPIRAASPTPSVRERAAAYERNIDEFRSPTKGYARRCYPLRSRDSPSNPNAIKGMTVATSKFAKTTSRAAGCAGDTYSIETQPPTSLLR